MEAAPMEAWELKAGVEVILGSVNRVITLSDLARGLGSDERAAEDALRDFEADLSAADRGFQVRHRTHGIRLESKPQFAALPQAAIPEWAPRPISEQAIEVVAIIAMKQPVSISDINAIRGIESTATLQTLRDRKLVARTAQLGPHREKYWRTTPLFLETFGVSSLDDLYKEGALEKAFPSMYSGVADDVDQAEEVEPQPDAATSG
jgi:segregation and condensation protein B